MGFLRRIFRVSSSLSVSFEDALKNFFCIVPKDDFGNGNFKVIEPNVGNMQRHHLSEHISLQLCSIF